MELDEVHASTMIFSFPFDGLIMLELSFEWDICVAKLLYNKWYDSLVDKR